MVPHDHKIVERPLDSHETALEGQARTLEVLARNVDVLMDQMTQVLANLSAVYNRTTQCCNVQKNGCSNISHCIIVNSDINIANNIAMKEAAS